MSHRGPASSKHVLPANPKWIEFDNTDGDPSLWPTNTTEVVDREGHVNYMRPVDHDEPLSIKWRVEVGKGVAKLANWDLEPAYALKTWPRGYQMFDHNKGPKAAPRHDAYLMGSTNATKFRSVPEFIPHAYWLLLPDDASRPPCQCKYCSKSGGQRAITATLGLLSNTRTPSTSALSPTPSRRVAPPPRVARPRDTPKTSYAAIRKKTKPPVVTQEPRQVFARDGNADLRAAYAKTNVKLKRWYREGELLWCAVSVPIRKGEGEEDSIIFWPGIVEEVKFKTEPVPHSRTTDEIDFNEKEQDPSTNWRITAHPSAAQDRGPMLEGAVHTPWSVQQYHLYKMKLLAVSQVVYLPDDDVLPYQVYLPPDQLLQAMRDVSLEQLNPDPERIASFNPFPALPSDPQLLAEFLESCSNSKRFYEAAAPYSIAMQIASGVAGSWSLTDEWEYKFTSDAVDFNQARSSGSMYPGSLHEVLAASMASNAAQHEIAESASSGPSLRRAASSSGPRQTLVQKRFQGLWWGTERIWVDDVVRLKVARRQIAPQGTQNIYKPAGPSLKTVEYNKAHGFPDPDGPEFDASGRGVFMRIENIYLADIQRDGGAKGEIRVSGMLYELADADWEEPEIQKLVQDSTASEAVTSTAMAVESAMTIGPDGSTGQPNSAQSDFAFPAKSAPHQVTESVSPQSSFHNSQLSHPRGSEQYPLPPPPTGFKFRTILPIGHEVVIDLPFISGRYYPRLLAHPLLQQIIERALRASVPPPGNGPSANEYLWAMEGLSPGCYNPVDPTHYRKDRVNMLREADKEAREQLLKSWQGRWETENEPPMPAETRLDDPDQVMEVDH